MKFDDKGRELPDPTPIEVPAGFKRPETLAEQIRRLVRHEQFAAAMGRPHAETFDEANDFEVDDDGELPVTRHEFTAMALEAPNGETGDADLDSRDREAAPRSSRDGGSSGSADSGEDAGDRDESERPGARDQGQRRSAGSRSVGDVKSTRREGEANTARRSSGASGASRDVNPPDKP